MTQEELIMTQEEFESRRKELLEVKNKQFKEAVAEYNERVEAAASVLRAQKEGARRSYAFFVSLLGMVERVNHEAHIRSNSHNFMRCMKKAANQFEWDAKEFSRANDDTAFSEFTQHFDIEPDGVTFTIKCKISRIQH